VTHVAKPDAGAGLPELKAYEPPAPPAAVPAWNTSLEQRQVAAIRDYRATIDGKPHQIVRGDLHRPAVPQPTRSEGWAGSSS
jgi:hypothetical protein